MRDFFKLVFEKEKINDKLRIQMNYFYIFKTRQELRKIVKYNTFEIWLNFKLRNIYAIYCFLQNYKFFTHRS